MTKPARRDETRCIGCLGVDDHPKHQMVINAQHDAVHWHHDCHAASADGCPICEAVIAAHPAKRGAELARRLTTGAKPGNHPAAGVIAELTMQALGEAAAERGVTVEHLLAEAQAAAPPLLTMIASGVYDAEANAALDARIPTSSTCDLFTVMPTASGGTVSGTKVVGGSYAQQTATMAAAASRSKATSAAVNFAGMPAVNGANFTVGIDLHGRWFMPLTTNRQTNAGDTLSFAIAAIAASLANAT